MIPAMKYPGPGVPEINDAIDAYQAALAADPGNARAWAESSPHSNLFIQPACQMTPSGWRAWMSLWPLSTRQLNCVDDDSTVHAVRAFVLDWQAFSPLVTAERQQELLIEAEREASRAFQLDPENPLALAYYAEILADQQKWTQAEKYAAQAVANNPGSMDTHRVYGYVLETLGQYNSAIQQYQEAARINPNLTFLYIRIGQNFREGIRNPDRALEYFDRAAKINEGLGAVTRCPLLKLPVHIRRLANSLLHRSMPKKRSPLTHIIRTPMGNLALSSGGRATMKAPCHCCSVRCAAARRGKRDGRGSCGRIALDQYPGGLLLCRVWHQPGLSQPPK